VSCIAKVTIAVELPVVGKTTGVVVVGILNVLAFQLRSKKPDCAEILKTQSKHSENIYIFFIQISLKLDIDFAEYKIMLRKCNNGLFIIKKGIVNINVLKTKIKLD